MQINVSANVFDMERKKNRGWNHAEDQSHACRFFFSLSVNVLYYFIVNLLMCR